MCDYNCVYFVHEINITWILLLAYWMMRLIAGALVGLGPLRQPALPRATALRTHTITSP